MRLKAKFPHIYLVAFDSEKTSSHRVTERDGEIKPKVCSFFGNVSTENPEVTYGTLVIDEELWKKWYKDGPFIRGMETAASAAETLTRMKGIFYGCPICSFHTKNYDEAQKHIYEHVNRFIEQFEFEIEEKENDKTSAK